jgi:photosystem II stability/assembly factor-like uncharacterized protein
MHCKITLTFKFLLSFPLALQLFTTQVNAQQFKTQNLDYFLTDSTTEKPVQYRRGIELQEGYQSYEEKYAGKNLVEEKRRLFPLQATGVWTELNPKVPRVDYLGIQFVNKDTGWAVGDLGALIKSTDGGTSWTVSQTNTTAPILKVRSYNGQVVIASGFGGLILRSTDGGETFTQVTSNVTGDLWGLQMINDTLGWSCGNANSLTKTTDGGQTWQRIFTPGYTSDYWWIDFLNESYGFIAANGKVLRTIDGGQNWEIIQAGDSYPLFSIDVIDSLHIAAAGYGGTGYAAKNIYSSDGGNNWVNGGQLTTEVVNCIQYVNPDTGYLVMTNVSARKTTNRGQNWTTIQGISDNYELQLLVRDNIGFSAGTGLKINKTDGGLDIWNRLIINDNFSDVFFVTEQKGFVISSSGLSAPSGLYKTTDGGINWQKHPSGLNGVDLLFLDSLIGFIGASNSIYKTTDGGNSWYPTQGTTGAGNIFFINETTGWAVHSGTIYKTTNSGENWFEQLFDIVGNFNSIYFVDSLYGWVSNLAEWLYKTTNGGENWVQQTNSNIFSTTDIYFRDSLNGFAIKLLELYETTNSGNNWVIQLNSQYVIRTFGWLSIMHGFIMGDGVYETIDSGNSWNEVLELRNIGLRKFQAPENYVGYSSGYLGLIYKYLDTTIVPVELTSFQADIDNNITTLSWSTSTETNNLCFEVFRSSDNQNWNSLVFINGNGTTALTHHYQFTDRVETPGIYYYKLKQLDYNGDFNYSNVIAVIIVSPLKFELFQNFPNPFNSSTKIIYQLPEEGFVSLKIYGVLGNEVKSLVGENKKAGYYSVSLNANDLSSGIYFYKLTAGEYSSTKKFILLK